MNEPMAFVWAMAAAAVAVLVLAVLSARWERKRAAADAAAYLRRLGEEADRLETLAQHRDRGTDCICVVCRLDRGTWRAAR